MKQSAVLGAMLVGAIVFPVAAVLAVPALSNPEESSSAVTSGAVALGNTAATLWIIGLTYFLATRPEISRGNGAAMRTGVIGAILLVLGFSSTAFYAWEEVAAGTELPTINLLVFLIPVGLFVVTAALFMAMLQGPAAPTGKPGVQVAHAS
nr:Uncharacterised protein [Streptococcus thermophilus]